MTAGILSATDCSFRDVPTCVGDPFEPNDTQAQAADIGPYSYLTLSADNPDWWVLRPTDGMLRVRAATASAVTLSLTVDGREIPLRPLSRDGEVLSAAEMLGSAPEGHLRFQTTSDCVSYAFGSVPPSP